MASAARSTDVFFVPFDCYLTCKLLRKTSPPRGADERERSTRTYFEAMEVSAGESDGGALDRPHEIHVGDFVMLRPPTNGDLPFIGRVVTFFRDAAKASKGERVRVQWFYHACDHFEKLSRSGGEDELLETPHFNDVDVNSLVGRCTVSSYEEYAKLTLLSTNITAAPSFDPAEPVDDSTPAVDDPASAAAAEDPASKHTSTDDAGSDSDVSMFGDNYSSVSTRYFCREYYDACLDATAVAEFDDPNADPIGEIADSALVDRGEHSDASLHSHSETEDDGSSDDDVGDGKKRRRRTAQGHGGKRPRTKLTRRRAGEGAVQFLLPNIGIDEVLPCREAEKATVEMFIRSAVESAQNNSKGTGRCLYISGVPGTGKTATVREVISSLRSARLDGSIAGFEVVEINGMALSDPGLIYSELYAAIVGRRGVPPNRAQLLLGERFASTDERRSRGISAASVREHGKCVILMLDELDILVSRSQQLLHTILEWAARPHSRLAIIGIANTMDLPERLLSKSKSRMGDNRLVYAPYNKDQLLEILELRLRDYPLEFEKNAKVLVASKIASLSGDVRRALELCRRATVVAQSSDEPVTAVNISHVNDAVGEMTGGARLNVVSYAPLNDKLILIASLLLSRSMGAFDVDSCTSCGAVFRKCREIAGRHQDLFPWGEPMTEELENAVSRLARGRLILVERDARPFASRIIVNMSPDDIVYALDEDDLGVAELQHKQKSRS